MKLILFCWVTSALVSHLYRKWVLTFCHEIGFILLSDLCFGVSSLQGVSVDFVPWNWFHFAEWPLLWCLISTDCEYWLSAMKLVLFYWVICFDLYRKWVLTLCHEIGLLLLSDLCFGVSSLQIVSVDFLPWISLFSGVMSALVSKLCNQWVLVFFAPFFWVTSTSVG